ncbi:MAG: hypothetical protein H6712_15175 [Myxococcales bacterium]|nr:hypothetical protein [Myxococcales bacterium]
MRPHQQTRTRASGLARARMLLKSKLGWLEGFPSGERWVVVPHEGERGPGPLMLERKHLRQATYTARKLQGEYPRAMPELVGDVDAWSEAVALVLARLKPWVHDGEAPSADLLDAGPYSRSARARAVALRRDHPELEPLLRALSWVLITRAALAPKALAWIEREATALGVVLRERDGDAGLVLALRCVHLALALGPRAVAPLTRLLAEPAVFTAVTHGATECLRQARGSGFRKPAPLPRPRLAPCIDAWVDRMLMEDRSAAKRALKLLELCDLGPLVAAWEQWWPPVIRKLDMAHGIQSHMEDESRRCARVARIRGELDAMASGMPPELEPRAFSEALLVASAEPFAAGFEPACRVLRRLGDGHSAALRAGLLLRWVLLATLPSWWEPRRLPVLLRAMEAHLRAHPDDASTGPWRALALRTAATGKWTTGLDEALLDEDLEPRNIVRFFEAMAWLREHAPTVDRGAQTYCIVRLLEALHDGELAARLSVPMLHHGQHDDWHDAQLLAAAWSAAEPEVEAFPALVSAIEALGQTTELPAKTLIAALLPAMRGDRALLRTMLLDDDRGPLLRCGRKLAVLAALGRPLRFEALSDRDPPDWLHEYPAALHDELRWLGELGERASAIAAKVLRSVRHGAAAIEAELCAIEARIAEAPPPRRAVLEQRRQTLRERLERAPAASPVRLERLRVKLRRRGGLELLTTAEGRADAALHEALSEHLRLPPTTPWLLDERVLSLMVPLLREPASTQRVATLLLRRRAGPPPWDLREHPANAAFIEGLRERGIDPGPWVDGPGEEVTRSKGRRMIMRLEDDPLEIFHMGRHFGTCLSPGHVNFFSVFTNAADIDKRVLFARDERERVIGRRLLCLTHDGALLTFHPYAHDQSWSFAERSTAFAHRLAKAMGTTVVGDGMVPTLVADRWYDDGPFDITGQLAVLEEGSAFRAALAAVHPEQLPALVASTFGRTELDEAIAPMVLSLPELEARPQLAAWLLPMVHHPEHLPPRACLVAGRLLSRAGALDQVRTRFVEAMARGLLLSHQEHRWMDPEQLEMLARAAPSRALRLLRLTRDRWVRRWDDEENADRLLAASIAMECLHRPRQALRLCRLAVEAPLDHGMEPRRRAQQRLQQLEHLAAPGSDTSA